MKIQIENGGLVNIYKDRENYTRAFSFFNRLLWVINDSEDKEDLIERVKILFSKRLPALIHDEEQSFKWGIDSEEENYLYIKQVGKEQILLTVNLKDV